MSCGHESDRNAYQVHLARINSSLIAEHAPKAGRSGERLRADGDADVEAGEKLRDFIVSPCSYCGGILKVNPSHLEKRGNFLGFDSTLFGLVFLGASTIVDP